MSTRKRGYVQAGAAGARIAPPIDDCPSEAAAGDTIGSISALSKLDLLRLVHDVAHTLRRRWDRQLRASIPEMSAARAAVILQLGRSGGASQTRLARLLGLSQMTVSRLLDDLEHQGWVQREPVPADRRSWAVRLTNDGRRVLIAVHRLARAFVERSCASIDEQHRATFVATLSALETGTRPARTGGGQTHALTS
jgi:DNA-binding MarR family transcriptional regulator